MNKPFFWASLSALAVTASPALAEPTPLQIDPSIAPSPNQNTPIDTGQAIAPGTDLSVLKPALTPEPTIVPPPATAVSSNAQSGIHQPATVTPPQPQLLSQAAPTPQPQRSLQRLIPVSQLEGEPAPVKPSRPQNSLRQVTSVSQLSDVQPTDWAFQALQSLVERYGCIVGYPDSTFRGNRALSRYEFAAGLNACMTRIEELIAATTTPLATKEDLAIVQKLQEEFAAELAGIRGVVDTLEARTAKLEAQQFSTTAVIGGEAIFALSQAFGGDPPGIGDSQVNFSQLMRLQLVSSFSGKDRLRMELSEGNVQGFGPAVRDAAGNLIAGSGVLNTNTALLSFQEDTDNDVLLTMLEYRFPTFKDRVVFTVRPVGFSLGSVLTTNWPYDDVGRGAISRFGTSSPLFKIGNLDAGFGVDWLINSKLRLQFAYGAQNAASPNNASGIFNSGSQTMGLQLLMVPHKNVLTGVHFVYGFNDLGLLETFTGAGVADASGFILQPANIYAAGGSLQWRINSKIRFATYGGAIATYSGDTNAGAVSTTYMFSLGFSDPFGRKQGDLLAVMAGQPPSIIEVGGFSGSTGLSATADSYHFEAFYRFTVNDNISITPGFFIVTNPGNFEDNNTIAVGVVRTTFRF